MGGGLSGDNTSPGRYKKRCKLHEHTFVQEIDAYLLADWSYGKINAWLVTEKKEGVIPVMTLSKHRRGCLGQPSRNSHGVPQTDDVTPNPIVTPPSDLASMAMPKVADVRDLGIKILYYRMRVNPASVGNPQLVAFVVEAMRADAKKPPSDPLADLLATLAGGAPGHGDLNVEGVRPEEQAEG